MVEGARLESVYTPKAYRGFESRPLRHISRTAIDMNGYGGILFILSIPIFALIADYIFGSNFPLKKSQ